MSINYKYANNIIQLIFAHIFLFSLNNSNIPQKIELWLKNMEREREGGWEKLAISIFEFYCKKRRKRVSAEKRATDSTALQFKDTTDLLQLNHFN